MISSLELARRCGVSQGTVDRALHGRPGISPKTRAKILRAAQAAGYRPHPAARELLTGRSSMVGALVPAVNNLFFMDLFQELAHALRARHFQLQLTPVADKAAFLAALEDAAARRHRLVLAIPPEEGITVPVALSAAVPLVTFFSPCRGQGIHFLSADEERTGREATAYLQRKGHRRIVHLTYGRPAIAIRARALGYRRQMEEAGLKPKVLFQPNPAELADLIEQRRPSAFFCHNDWLAIRTMLLLAGMGLRVPDDISVLGIDNSPTLIALHPGLTTLAYPVAAAIQAVVNLIDGKPSDLSGEGYRVIERQTVSSPIS